MLYGNIERRIFSIFQSCNVNKQETYQGQRGSDRLQTLECENSKKQPGVSLN